jgi:murein DD-endopeptidase MepM/ murein hydrolase activator NlpD
VRGGLRLTALISTLLALLTSFAAPLAADGPLRSVRNTTSAAAPTIHRVKSGETPQALVAANRLIGPDARLRVGHRLTIPGAGTPVARARRALAAAPRATSPPKTLVLGLPDFSELLPLFVWPVEGHLSSKFGRRRMGWHQGIDIMAELGTPVTASASGIVVGSSFESRYGRVIRIEHPNRFMTIYAHNNENLVEAGDRVTLGQVIAVVGRTGRATASHVHFEIRQAGLAYNPLYMLPAPSRVASTEETIGEDHEDADE